MGSGAARGSEARPPGNDPGLNSLSPAASPKPGEESHGIPPRTGHRSRAPRGANAMWGDGKGRDGTAALGTVRVSA